MEGYYIKKVGHNKGAPRIWLDGSATEKAGFVPGQRYNVDIQGHSIVLQANPDGSRVVSGKRQEDKDNPVIDLNSKQLLAIFDGMSAIRVVVRQGEIFLLPLASEIKKKERYGRLKEKLEKGETLDIGSVSHGGGVMSHAIHAGLAEAGIKSKLAFANDIREELLEHAFKHNDVWSTDTQLLAAPLQELAFDDRGLTKIPKVDLLELGLPCSGASPAGMARRGLKHPESHPEVGHLVVSALIIVNRSNAAVVILENVPNYGKSASAEILRTQLRDMGYVTHERILNGKQWGMLENRDRWFMVAVTQGIEFDFDQLLPPAANEKKLGDVLEAIPVDDPRWSHMTGLKLKEERDLAAGKGFRMQVFNAESDHIGTLTKGYAKVRSTDPKISHPTNPDLLRQLTFTEHARIKGIPVHLVSEASNTMAHEILGQSVIYDVVKDVGHHIGNGLQNFAGGQGKPFLNRVEYLPQETVDLASEVVYTLLEANDLNGIYSGQIAAIDNKYIIQDVGRGQGVVHDKVKLESIPGLGGTARVEYTNGHALVNEKTKHQLSLSFDP